MSDLKSVLLPVLVPLAVSAFVGAVLWLAARCSPWLKAKAASAKMQWAYDLLASTAGSLVAHAQVEVRPLIVADLSRGSMTAAEGAALKASVVKTLKETLDDQLAAIKKALGISTEGGLDKILSGVVETVLARMQASNTLPAAPTMAVDQVAKNIGTAANALAAAGGSMATLKVTPSSTLPPPPQRP